MTYTCDAGIIAMIVSFADKETEKIFSGQYSTKLPFSIQKSALRKLMMMHSAATVEELRFIPGNHLEVLRGDRKGQYSIRINSKYRICFASVDNYFVNVEIVDYH